MVDQLNEIAVGVPDIGVVVPIVVPDPRLAAVVEGDLLHPERRARGDAARGGAPVRVWSDHMNVQALDSDQLLAQGIQSGGLDPVVVGDQDAHTNDSRLTASPQTVATDTAAGSTAAVGDDQLGQRPKRNTCREHQETELAIANPAHRVPDLSDDVEDRPGGDRVEEKLERLGLKQQLSEKMKD